MMVDVAGSLGVTGKEAAEALEEAGIACNFNQIPFDPRPPRVSSGIRLGTPAITTRGFREAQTRQVGQWIVRVLQNMGDEKVRREVRQETRALCRAFPLG